MLSLEYPRSQLMMNLVIPLFIHTTYDTTVTWQISNFEKIFTTIFLTVFIVNSIYNLKWIFNIIIGTLFWVWLTVNVQGTILQYNKQMHMAMFKRVNVFGRCLVFSFVRLVVNPSENFQIAFFTIIKVFFRCCFGITRRSMLRSQDELNRVQMVGQHKFRVVAGYHLI